MSIYGYSLPAGVSTLPGEEDYYCPVCGIKNFTGVVDNSWPEGLPGSEEYCSVSCGKAAQLGYRKEVKMNEETGDWDTTHRWVNAEDEPVSFKQLIDAGIEFGAVIGKITKDDIESAGGRVCDCAVSKLAERLFDVVTYTWYDEIKVGNRSTMDARQYYRTGPKLQAWLMTYDDGIMDGDRSSVPEVEIAFIKSDLFAEVI